jgi:putative ABC transport system permease protein
MESLLRDLRHSARALLRAKGFTAVAVLTLALGIGANSAIFSLVDAVVLKPLPYPVSDRLVLVWAIQEDPGDPGEEAAEEEAGGVHDRVSPAEFFRWREGADLFEGMAAFMFWNFTLTGEGEPQSLLSAAVTPDLLPLLGVEPTVGRNFTPDEAVLGRGDVVLLSHSLWQRRFGGDPAVVGEKLTLDGVPHTVVGVLPAGLEFPHPDVELWTPMAFNPQGAWFRRPSVMVLGRLDEGVTPAQADQEMRAITRALDTEFPGRRAVVRTLLEQRIGRFRPVFLSLVTAVATVLLIACVNVANLVLARTVSQEREMAVREALGASRFALLRRSLGESLVLSVAGGAVGLAIAVWGIRLLAAVSPVEIPRIEQTGLDLRVLGFTFVLVLAAAVVFALVPLLRGTRGVARRLHSRAGLSGSLGPRRIGLNQVLIVVEIALALFLLVATGLILRSMVRLQNEPRGFSSDHVLAAQLILPESRYTNYRASLFYKRLVDGLHELPGVEAVGAVSALPMNATPTDFEIPFEIDGRPVAAGAIPPHARLRIATDGYFDVLGIPLRKGRGLSDRDRSGQPRVAVINQTLAHRFWSDGDALGSRLTLSFQGSQQVEVVGIVGDVRDDGAATAPAPEIFVPFPQVPIRNMVVALRTTGDPRDLSEPLKREIWERDPALPVATLTTMKELMAESLGRERFHLWLLGAFAVTALLLASVGIHGVMSHGVQLRTREIGLRMALGAQTGQVLRLVLRRVATLTAAGLALGMVLVVGVAGAFGPWIADLLYRVSPLDPLTYVAAAVLLTAVALVAGYLPARWASGVDPRIALKSE